MVVGFRVKASSPIVGPEFTRYYALCGGLSKDHNPYEYIRRKSFNNTGFRKKCSEGTKITNKKSEYSDDKNIHLKIFFQVLLLLSLVFFLL